MAGPHLPEGAQPVLRPRRGRAARQAAELEAGLQVRRPVGGDPPRRGALLRPRAAGHRPQALRRRQVVPHGLHLRGQEHRADQLPGRRGAQGRRDPPEPRGRADPPGRRERRRLPLRRHRRAHGQRGRQPDPPARRDVRRDRVQGADHGRGRDGHAAGADAIAAEPAEPERPGGPPPGRQRRPHRRPRVRPEEDPQRAGPARLRPVPQGQADHDDELRLLGRAPRAPARRHALHAPGDLPLQPDQLPLRRRARPGRRRLVVGAPEEAGHRELEQPDRAARDGGGHPRRHVRGAAPAGRCDPPELGPGVDRDVLLPPVRAVARGPRAGQPGDEAGRRARRPGQVHEADRDPGRLRVAPARRGAHGRVRGARGGGPPLRGVRQRGPVLHGLERRYRRRSASTRR